MDNPFQSPVTRLPKEVQKIPLTARETQMYEMLQYIDQETSKEGKGFDLKLKHELKQLIKQIEL